MDTAKEFPEPGKISKQSRNMISKKPATSQKTNVFGIYGAGNSIGLIEFSYKHSDHYLTTYVCKSHHGGSLFRIKKTAFQEKMLTST